MSRKIRHLSLLAAGTVTVGLLAACSQSSGGSTGDTSTTAAATSGSSSVSAAAAAAPAKFADHSAKIAVVAQISSGDYFEQWKAGAEAQAKKLGISLEYLGANGDDAQHATDLQQVINEKVDAIVVDHGFAETIDPVIAKAVAAGIPVIAFDVDPGKNKVITLDQSDKDIASQALSVLKQDTGGSGKVIYAYVAGFAPLDKRNAVWEQYKKDNPGTKQVAQIGVVNDNTASQVADQAKAALQANPDVTAIFAPYDEFAKGATQAVQELGLQDKVKVYGADISTADIGVITASGSPWVATSATDPSNVGAVAIRAAALQVAGDPVPDSIEVEPALITQKQLVDGKIKNISQLVTAVPQLVTPDTLPIPWLSN